MRYCGQSFYHICLFSALLLFVNTTNASPYCDVVISPGQDFLSHLGGGTSLDRKWVCLSEGTHYVNQSIDIPSHTVLNGVGSNSNVIINSSANSRKMKVSGKTNVNIQNLTLQGNGGADDFGILSYNSTKVTIAGVIIKDIQGIGIGITGGSSDITVSYGRLQNTGLMPGLQQAIWTNDSTDVSINGVRVVGKDDGPGGDMAIACFNTSYYTVSNVVSTDSGSSAIYLDKCTHFEISNNQLSSGNEWGVDMVNQTAYGTVDGNTMTGFKYAAIVVTDAYGGDPHDIMLTNNSMTNNNISGVANCQSMSIDASESYNITVGTGNSANPAPISCDHHQ